MFEHGLTKEVKELINKYPDIINSQSFQAIGYKETVSFLKAHKTLEQVINRIAQVTRNYAKRQFTWFNARTDLNQIEDFSSKKSLDYILNAIH